MDINGDQIRALVAQLREALTIELKAWIDPTTPVAQAKIVRAALALRNRNGGFLVVDRRQDLLPAPHVPADVRATFRPDDIQQLYRGTRPTCLKSPWSSRTGMARSTRSSQCSSGVTVPVAIKGDLIDGNKALLKFGEVPFRTLHANGTFSTAAARPEEGHCRDLLRQSRSGRGSLRSSAPWRTYCRDALQTSV